MKNIFFLALTIAGLLFSCNTEQEKLVFEVDNLKFEITDKSSSQEAIDLFSGFTLNSSTGQFQPNVKTEAPAKGMVYAKFKIRVTNFNIDTVKINSADLIVQTSDGKDFIKSTEFDMGFSPGDFNATILPDTPKEMEFLITIPEKRMNNVKLLYKANEGAIINFKK